MIFLSVMQVRFFRASFLFFVFLLTVTCVSAALFEDDDARKAIIELRQRADALKLDADLLRSSSTAESAGLGRSLLDLQRQIELLRGEISTLRGANEQLKKDLADSQRLHKDQMQVLNDRLSKLEPLREKIDGVDFTVEPAEKRDFESALTLFRKGEFATAQTQFAGFIGRYPVSGYATSALFWLGNAQYATRDYKEAIINFKSLVSKEPSHARAAESALSIANCQLELKDSRAARKTLTDLIKAYPQSEAAIAAKERLATLK
jgi:tol-pal system protein YbgF